MAKPIGILILGGTEKARKICYLLARFLRPEKNFFALATQTTQSRNAQKYRLIYSLAGVSQSPRLPQAAEVEVVSGGFGGYSGLLQYLQANNIRFIIEALHPFAAKMRIRAREAAHVSNCNLFHLQRKFWQCLPGDFWLAAESDLQALQLLQRHRFQRPLVTLGAQRAATWLPQLRQTELQLAVCRALNWQTTPNPIKHPPEAMPAAAGNGNSALPQSGTDNLSASFTDGFSNKFSDNFTLQDRRSDRVENYPIVKSIAPLGSLVDRITAAAIKGNRIVLLNHRPTYTLQQEIYLINQLNCDVMIARNSGHQAAYKKIIAARACAIPVILISPPPQPAGTALRSIFVTIKTAMS